MYYISDLCIGKRYLIMKLIRKYLLTTLIYFSLFSFISADTYGQVRLHASVNKRSILLNDLVTVQFNIDNVTDVEQFIPPSFHHCKIVQGPMQVTGSSTVNGVESSYVSFVYVIQPLAEGKHAFSGASAKVNGNRFGFNSVHVKVSEPDAASYTRGNSRFYQPEAETSEAMEKYRDYILYETESLHDKIRRNLFIKVDVNKNSCYEGEPVVASYKLYTRLHSASKVSRRPSFNGFSVFDMVDPTIQPATIEKLNGKEFNVYLIRKAQLFPLQSGELELDPAEVENSISFIRSEYAMKDQGVHLPEILRHFESDRLGHEAIASEKVSIRSNPVTVTVKALPDENKPSSFNGAVGKFSIEANVDKKELTLDDVATLRVIVKGEGNFCIMNAPTVRWPATVEAYEPTSKEDFLKSVVPLRGYKTFQFTFMPKKEGKTVIPGVEFSYFDVDANRYRTLKTDSLVIHTLPGIQADIPAAVESTSGIGADDRIWIIAGSILLLTVFGYVLYRNIRSTPTPAKQRPSPVPHQPAPVENEAATTYTPDPLFNARLLLIQQNEKGFYSTLHKTLVDVTVQKTGLPSGTGKLSLEQELKNRNWDEDLLSQLSLVLQQCEEALYMPDPGETDMQSVYDLAKDYIDSLDNTQPGRINA